MGFIGSIFRFFVLDFLGDAADSIGAEDAIKDKAKDYAKGKAEDYATGKAEDYAKGKVKDFISKKNSGSKK